MSTSVATDTKDKAQPSTAGIVVVEWKRCEKGESLKGFVDLQLPSGMVIHGCTFHQRGDARWVAMPGRQFEKDGTKSWVRVIDFADRPTYERFQKAALQAVSGHLTMLDAAKKKTP